MRTSINTFTVALALVILGGCVDPVVGEWESKDELVLGNVPIGRITFEVDDELEGEGSMSDVDCTFDVDVSDEGDDKYEVEWALASCGLETETYDCELDEDILECDLPGLKVDFERQD